MKLALIAAVARDGAIGRANELLWHEPQDQKHFRATTLGCPVVMGRKTWESLPARFRPLPGRRNVVVTRDAGYDAPGAELASSLEAALTLLQGTEKVFVIGGGELYAAALPMADELVLTEIDAVFPGADTFFPAHDPAEWAVAERHTQHGADGTPFAFVTYRRTQP